MPTFYEGDPIEIIEQELDIESYQKAYLLQEQNITSFHQPAVKAGLCLTASAVFASLIPWYLSVYATVWIPCCGIFLGLVLSVFFWRTQPNIIKNWAGKVFLSNRMLGLPCKIFIYRDSLIVKNQYETYREYWTDYEKCLESRQFFLLCGGMARKFLILKKDGMTREQAQKLSVHFQNEFAGRYRFVKDGIKTL